MLRILTTQKINYASKYQTSKMTREKEHSDSTLMPTTETMRNKADFVRKGFIYILKCLRCSKCTKGHEKESKRTKQKQRDGEA